MASHVFSALWNAASMLTGGRGNNWGESPRQSPEHSYSSERGSQQSTPTPSPAHSRSESTPSGRPSWPDDAGFSEDFNLPPQWAGSGSRRLFIQLLDDLDDISTNSPSAHRRRRAREIFSEWIFSADMRSPVHHPAGFTRNDQFRRSSAAEYGPRRRSDIVTRDDKALRRPCSGDFSEVDITRGSTADDDEFPPAVMRPKKDNRVSPAERENRRRSVPPIFLAADENENDSGYHTGPGYRTVLPRRPPSEQTLTRDDLRRRIREFNRNNHGLVMDLPAGDSNTFQGGIRVHMNLTRPINMRISFEPPTLFDVREDESLKPPRENAQVTSFYLPKDTTKVIHISSNTTTAEVIRVLLAKYHITDNPRKFALYEKITEPEKPVVLRRMSDDEMPLQICLSWTSESINQLDHNQFVLQENDTGEILWEAFSLPELENFLSVLNREEEEYVNQVRTKYRLLKVRMRKQQQKLETIQRSDSSPSSAGAKRTPVFV